MPRQCKLNPKASLKENALGPWKTMLGREGKASGKNMTRGHGFQGVVGKARPVERA